jgi:DNA mismatch repair protein MutS
MAGADQALSDEALADAAGVRFPDGAKITPMLRQWLTAKARAPDAVLLFRMGDFYELFHVDAEDVAPELDLVVTSRDKKGDSSIAMAGFPHHAAPQYIAKLIANGRKVAVCDQLEDPAMAKGIVKRGVTRVVTPGMVIDDAELDTGAPNHLVGACVDNKGRYGVAALDLSTGRFIATLCADEQSFVDEVARLSPAELVLGSEELREITGPACAKRVEVRAVDKASRKILEELGPMDRLLEERKQKAARDAAAVVAAYVADAQSGIPSHVRPPRPYAVEKTLLIDATTRRHLDLTGPSGDLRSPSSLLGVLDRTKTALGGRLLLRWMVAPSAELAEIERRLDAVDAFVREAELRARVREALAGVYDVERLTGRVASGRAGPQDLARLRASLARFAPVLAALRESAVEALQPWVAETDDLADLAARLGDALVDEPPAAPGSGGVFRPGFDADLDELRDLAENGRDRITGMEASERERTGIPSLKVKYTRVFGYYLEVTKTHLDKVPDDYKRKQTVANAERYVTDALARLEEQVATAETKLAEREKALFESLRAEVAEAAQRLLATARDVAAVDVLASFADVSAGRRYVRPQLLPSRSCRMEVESARHPVVEHALEAAGEPFVPSDLKLDGERQIILVTGPNMAGKSTLLRQVAILQVMAQMGCFVPATRAELSLCDRVFTRVGASDDLAGGRSTFMVEMTETAHILRHATKSSIVLLDEIGRGTSTFDGVSIAWAVAEHLHDEVGARSLFATHYHELCELEESLERLANVHVVVKEWNDKIVFTRTLADGPAERSYGIQVARLAGLPAGLLSRAREVLAGLEGDVVPTHDPGKAMPKLKVRGKRRPQMDLFGGAPLPEQPDPEKDLVDDLADVDVNRTSPIEAMNVLARLVDRARKLQK